MQVFGFFTNAVLASVLKASFDTSLARSFITYECHTSANMPSHCASKLQTESVNCVEPMTHCAFGQTRVCQYIHTASEMGPLASKTSSFGFLSPGTRWILRIRGFLSVLRRRTCLATCLALGSTLSLLFSHIHLAVGFRFGLCRRCGGL